MNGGVDRERGREGIGVGGLGGWGGRPGCCMAGPGRIDEAVAVPSWCLVAGARARGHGDLTQRRGFGLERGRTAAALCEARRAVSQVCTHLASTRDNGLSRGYEPF